MSSSSTGRASRGLAGGLASVFDPLEQDIAAAGQKVDAALPKK
ncbi:MAG TPA: hypothetical protein VIK22_06505 [Candidatus Anoxymicrobiaceae bacterium]